MQKFLPFNKIIGVRREITLFVQKVGETFPHAWRRFSLLIDIVPNHGFLKPSIMNYFYNGLNDESRQMIDSAA
jgi:hypothetical protein